MYESNKWINLDILFVVYNYFISISESNKSIILDKQIYR